MGRKVLLYDKPTKKRLKEAIEKILIKNISLFVYMTEREKSQKKCIRKLRIIKKLIWIE